MNFVAKFEIDNNIIMFTRFNVDNNIIMMNRVNNVVLIDKVILMF